MKRGAARGKRKSVGRRARVALIASFNRSAVTNGTKLIAGKCDRRSRDYRRWRDLYRGYLRQTGGKHEELCRSLASLVLSQEKLDAALIRGDPVDALHAVRLSGAIHRAVAKLASLSKANEAEKDRKRREQEDREAGLIA